MAYQKILQLAYIEELLETVKTLFIDMFSQTITSNYGIDGDYHSFDNVFTQLLRQLEDKYTSVSDKGDKQRVGSHTYMVASTTCSKEV